MRLALAQMKMRTILPGVGCWCLPGVDREGLGMTGRDKSKVKTSKKNFKKYILPIMAGVLAIAAMIVLLVVPGRDADQNSAASLNQSAHYGAADNIADSDENGEIIIRTESLSGDRVSFIRISDDSRIELLARLGDDGTAKVALGTCQSCNGAPGAYYTQEGDVLKCNNCGRTFPLAVIDSPGGGCHPIMLDDTVIGHSDGNAVVHVEALAAYEPLFEKVTEHG